MRINLLYNKIVADTASEAFVESFNQIALPKLQEKFPGVDEVIIYEDYLSDGLFANGNFYCPLTLVKEGRIFCAFASWRCDSKRFENSIPYAYLGKELLNIEISDSAPETVEEKLKGRVPFFAENAIKLSVAANAPTKTFLSGKYSQSFVDVMRENLTRALEIEFNVEGIKDSSLEITLMFAPESFMEHVLDNVSYRRVLISASGCAPRDLWIKWTRLDGKGTYTVSNHVKKSEIIFELCDEVPEKIREREYRYLLKTEGLSAYKAAMSRKNFTEWRELIKRVIKRGEVVELADYNEEKDGEKVLSETYAPEKTPELQTEPLAMGAPEQSSELSLEYSREADLTAETEKEDGFDSEISLKLQSVLESYNIDSDSPEEPDEEEEINPDLTELLRALISGGKEADVVSEEELSSEDAEEDELPPFDIEEAYNEEEEMTLPEAEEAEEIEEDEVTEESEEEEPDEAEPEAQASFSENEYVSSNPVYQIDDGTCNDMSEKENEILSLKERNEELSQKLSEAEAEKARLLELVSGYEKKIEEARRERATLIENLDAAKRREERERERLAEAAKLAIAERSEAEKPVCSEEISQDSSVEEKSPIVESAPALQEAAQTEEHAHEPLETIKNEPVRYVSKVAEISFRHPVDPNITKRIQDIIVTTVKYMGKENVYMKIKATIPDNYMVRLEFVKIPENESELLSDIIRVLGHSRLGITKVLLD